MAGELTFKTYSPLKKGEGYEYTFKASNSALSKLTTFAGMPGKPNLGCLKVGTCVEALIPNHRDS